MAASQARIIDALSKFDPENEAHWTQAGLPRLEVLQKATGDDELARLAIKAAAPDFTRENPALPVAELQPEAPDDKRAEGVEDERTKIKARQDVVELGLQQANLDLAEVQNRRDALIKERDRLIYEYDQRFPKMSAGENMRRWLDAQHRERTLAAEQSSLARKALGLEDVPTASELDRVMALKPKPFSDRPTVASA